MNNIIAVIKKNMFHNKNYIVGIDGGTGAGKTTLANNLQSGLKELGLRIITLHIDDFIHKRNIRYDDSKEGWVCFYDLQWRYDYLTSEILIPAKTNQNINKNIQIYNKQVDEYEEIPILAKAPYIIILEGVFLQRKELKRALSRDTYIGDVEEIIDKYERRYFPAEDYYFKEYNPMNTADFIFKGMEVINAKSYLRP